MKSLEKKYIFIIFAVFLVIWGFFFLCFIPGQADNDAEAVFKMILGLDFYDNTFRYTQLNDHNPLIYTFFNWAIFSIGKIFCNDNLILVTIVCAVQMIIVIICIVYAINKLYRFSNSLVFIIIAGLFFLINPLIIQYSLSHWKDAIFGFIIFLMCLNLFHMIAYFDDFKKNKWNLIILISMPLLCAFWRKNGIIISVVVLIIMAIKWSALRKICLASLLSIFAIFISVTLVKSSGLIQSAHFAESVSIPLQQIAYTAKTNDNLGEEQEFFENIIGVEEMKKLYVENSADEVKFSPNFNDDFLETHKLEFFINWAKLGASHIPEYATAWVKQTEAFWNPAAETWFTLDYIGLSLENGKYLQKNILENLIDCNELKSSMDSVLNQYNPIYNPAILFYILLLTALICIIRKKTNYLIILIPLLLLWFSLMLATPASDFRYVYPLHLCLPLIIYLHSKTFLPSK